MDTRHWAFKPILLFVSIGSFLISWIFTCNLLASMATTGFATIIAFGLATVLEPAKIVFMALGATHKDLMALLVGICLTLLSIVGTIGFLQVQHAEKLALQTQSSAGFQALQGQISDMDSQIAGLQAVAKQQRTINHVTRSAETEAQANALLEQKAALTQQLATYTPATGQASNALYNSLSVFFGGLNPTLIELWINSIYGILLELVAIISGVYVFKNSNIDVAQVQRGTMNRQSHQTGQRFENQTREELPEAENDDPFFDEQEIEQPEPVRVKKKGFWKA